MKIFYRHLYWEILSVAFMATFVLTVLLLLANASKEISVLLLNREVSGFAIAKLTCLLVPFVLTFTLPWGLLLAVLLVFGRLSSDRELVILKSSGIGLATLIAPVVLLSLVFSLFSFWVNAYLGPRSQEAVREEIAELLRHNSLSFFSTGQPIQAFSGYRIYIGKRDAARAEDVHLWEIDKEGHALRSIRASSAEIMPDLNNNRIVLNLFNVRLDDHAAAAPDDVHQISSGTRAAQFPMEVPLGDFFTHVRETRGPGLMTLHELTSRIFDPAQILRIGNMSPFLTELQKRISFSFASFTFVLVGIPLAIQTRRRETSAGLGLSLLIVFSYYLLFLIAETLKAQPRFFPEAIIWMPNVCFEALGLFLIARVNYDRA